MAMTTCPECNSALPSDAESCPTCGHSVTATIDSQSLGSRKFIIRWGIVILISASIACLALVLSVNRYYRFIKASALKPTTLSNVKAIGTGLEMYSTDNDSYYPQQFGSNQDLREVLAPYLKYEDVFETHNPNTSAWLPNKQIQSFSSKAIVLPEKTVTIYESKAWLYGGKFYGFVDTHAGFLSSEEGITFDPKK